MAEIHSASHSEKLFESSNRDVESIEQIPLKDTPVELKALRKVDLSVLPLLFLGLLVFQLDRMNVASALTSGFAADIHVDQNIINLGNQMMFLGIVVLEIPSNMILQRVGPRKYIAAQVFVFGFIATLQVFVRSRNGFLVVRSFLGLAEAGYIPGAIYTLSTWYRRRELAKRVAIFFFGMFGGNAISPLLASGILKLDKRHGISGWQWIFLIEGVFTMSVAILLILFLPGSPEHPRPLFFNGIVQISEEEGAILQRRIAADYPEKEYKAQHIIITPQKVWKTISHWRRWPHFIATSLVFSTWSPLITYTPSIIVSLGFNKIQANALASVGAFLALFVVFLFAWFSDHSNQRGLAVGISIACYLIILIIARSVEEHVGKWSRWGLWSAVNAFAVGYHPVHNTWLQLNCSDPAERSISIAMWVMCAITGLMYGTQYFRASDIPFYQTGLAIMIGTVAAGLALCDETKPICQRCTKSRRICVETIAAKQAVFSIHVENNYASGKSKRPRGPRSSLTLMSPHFDLQTRALAYYLQYHLQTSPDKTVPIILGGLSESVYSWKISGGTSHMVDLALSSMALSIYSRTQRNALAATEASLSYYRLLQVVREQIVQVEIQTLNEQNIDACLLAIFLMGRYEAAKHRPDPNSEISYRSSRSWYHHNGAMAILKVWNDNLSHNTPTTIIKQTRRGLVRSALLRNLPLPTWLLNGSRFGEHGIELEYDCIFVRIVKLHYSLSCLQQKNYLQTAKVEELNNEAQDLDKALRDWATQISSTSSCQQHIVAEPGPWPKRHFYSSTVYSYSSPWYAAVWTQYFAIRMLVNSTRLKTLELNSTNPLNKSTYEQQRLECLILLNEMSDNLASSIPFSLERLKTVNQSGTIRQSSIKLNDDEIKPYLIHWVVWQLTIVSSIEAIDHKHQLWFKSELASLGRIIGDGILEWAETDQWTTL
ncbi:hypothetical protein B7463_g6605, partial [Scytalidium lignicola]